MDSIELLARVRTVVDATLDLQGRALRFEPSTRLLGAVPELDSMAVADLVIGLEQEFGIAIQDDEVRSELFATVDTLRSFVAGKLKHIRGAT